LEAILIYKIIRRVILARNHITTVDIGTNSVKIMQLGLTQTGLLVLNHGEKEYPHTSASDKVSDEVIIDTLTQLISEKNFKTKDVALSIQDNCNSKEFIRASRFCILTRI